MNALTFHAAERSPGRSPASASQRLLIVDDDACLSRLEATILKSAGYQVDTAAEAETAFHALSSGLYDALVTDNLMPGLSGVGLVRQMRGANIQVPVVMVSGSLESLDLERLRDDPWSRIFAFVHKPFRSKELLSAVAAALLGETSPVSAGWSEGGLPGF